MNAPNAPPLRVFTPNPPLRLARSAHEIWSYRGVLWQLAAREVRVRYKQTALGAAWAVLQPLSMMVVFTIFFGRLAQLPSDGVPYPLFYFSALVPWSFFAGSLSAATNSLINEAGLLTKIYFPRAVIPVASLLAASLDFAIATLILGGMLAIYGVVPSITWGLLPFFLAIQVLFTFGAGCFLSALNVTYRDVRYAIPLLLQLWLYATPIVYPFSLVPPGFRLWYVLVNPMSILIDGYRTALLRGKVPDLPLLALAAIVSLAACVAAFAYFRKAEREFADII
jgi:lipopolysaccharide transport system permease protein